MEDKEYILNNIKKREELLEKYKKRDMLYIINKRDLRDQYEEVGNKEKSDIISREIINIILKNNEIEKNEENIEELDKIILSCYDNLARNGDFESFLIALEWDRKKDKRFYMPRMKLLKKHGIVQALQDLSDGKYKILSISMPPRTGKSTISLFYVLFRMGLQPDKAILGSGHSTALVQTFYKEVIGLLQDEDYRFNKIFPKSKLVDQNAEYLYMDLEKKRRFHSVTFRSVDGTTTGAVEAGQLLYIDDLIKDPEHANSLARLEKTWEQFTGSLKDRMLDSAQMLSIGTMWNLEDPISKLERIYKNDPKVKIMRVSCYDENEESNFLYDGGVGFSTSYYKDMELTEDPVIFSAKYLANPIERDGRPFADLQYYLEKPTEEPDRIVSAVDVAYGGGDRYSMPIAYVYGRDVYIEDVIYEKRGLETTRPKTVDRIIHHQIQRVCFEANNGGDQVALKVNEILLEKIYKCNITHKKAPGGKTRKIDRILAVQHEILGVAENPGTFRIFFKDKSIQNQEYKEFVRDIRNFSDKDSIQGKQVDDGVDSLASLITNVLAGSMTGKAVSRYSRKDLSM